MRSRQTSRGSKAARALGSAGVLAAACLLGMSGTAFAQHGQHGGGGRSAPAARATQPGNSQPSHQESPAPRQEYPSYGSRGGQSHLQYAPPGANQGQGRAFRAPEAPAFHAGNSAQPGGGPPIYRGSAPNRPPADIARPGHLGSWMQQHQNLSPQDQQRALEREPGFNQLPPDQQARMRSRLQQLNAMGPQQRQQVLNRVEGMERLTPEQRQQVTSTMGQLRALPPEQKQAVTRAFANVRQLPPGEREAAARNYAAGMNPQQREAFNNLVHTEPYLPIQRSRATYGPQ